MGDHAAWLSAAHKSCVELLGPLDEEYGVDEVEGLLDLDPEDVDALVDRCVRAVDGGVARLVETTVRECQGHDYRAMSGGVIEDVAPGLIKKL
eukprot:COSAG01_NODE_8592_length_2725_cov_20.421173_1_plen_93_part_00